MKGICVTSQTYNWPDEINLEYLNVMIVISKINPDRNLQFSVETHCNVDTKTEEKSILVTCFPHHAVIRVLLILNV